MSNTIHASYSEHKKPSFDTLLEGFNKKLPTGEKLPFNVKISGEVFSFQTTGQIIEIAKDIFFKMTSDGPEFKLKESDQWDSFENIFTGNIEVSLKTDGEENLFGEIHLNLNVR